MLKRAIESAMAQTFLDFELIVIDDGSRESVESYIGGGTSLPRSIRVLTHEHCQGVGAARNTGIRHAKGRYISFLDDDDELLPEFLDSTARTLDTTSSDIGFSWTNVQVVDYSGTEPKYQTREFSGTYRTQTQLFAEILSLGTCFGITIKAECFRRVGYFDPSLRVAGDIDMFFRLLTAKYLPVLVPAFGMRIHNHVMDRLTSTSNNRIRLSVGATLIDRHRDFLDSHPALLDQLKISMNKLCADLVGSEE
jgi:glycosyltransferase involved in cell wall biosynthesis